MADSTDLMIKLFDTLKQSSDKGEIILQKLIEQQHNLIGHIEYLPIKELQEALKDHNIESKGDINTCTETVESKSDTILEKVQVIESKISKAILVIIVAFTLFSAAFGIARLALNPNKLKQTIEREQTLAHQKIIDAIKESMLIEFSKIRKEMIFLHKDEQKNKDESDASNKRF
jgi:hypothetical protein